MLRESGAKRSSFRAEIHSKPLELLCDGDTGVSSVELCESTRVVVVVVVVVVGGGGGGRGGGHKLSLTLFLRTALSLELYHIPSLNPVGNLDSFFLLLFYFPYFIEDYRNTELHHLCRPRKF